MYIDIIKNICAISRFINDYEFIHVYFGPQSILKETENIKLNDAYHNLKCIRKSLSSYVDDCFPYFRKTYYETLLDSVLLQIELFCFNNCKKNTKEIVETMYGIHIPGLFDLSIAKDKVLNEITSLGYTSIKEFYNDKNNICLNDFKDLSEYVFRELNYLTEKFKVNFIDVFEDLHFDSLLNLNKISVIKPERGMPSCYYYYRGNYRGVIAVTPKKEYSDTYLKSLIAHEIFPGHHFYYVVRESLFKSKKMDVGVTLDIFFSPEVILNEGLAMAVDLLFFDIVDNKVKIKGLLEKYIHQILYNIWYCRFVTNNNYAQYYTILTDDIGMQKSTADELVNYYLDGVWKYYTISYALGSYYVDKFIEKYGRMNIPYLYTQHSIKTIIKLQNVLDQQNVKDGFIENKIAKVK